MYIVTNPLEFLGLVGSDIFFGCNSLENINFTSKFNTSINIGVNVSNIGAGAFENCINVDVVNIKSSNLINLSDNLFKNCITLNDIILPNTISTIGTSTFENCLSIDELTFPENLTSIGVNAFLNCANLAVLRVFNNINSIDSTSFDGCIKLLNTSSGVILTNELNPSKNYALNYFKLKFENVSYYPLEEEDLLALTVLKTKELLNISIEKAREYVYPSLAIKLKNENTLIVSDVNFVSNEIESTKVNEFRNLILDFIFKSNPDYTNFIVNYSKFRFDNMSQEFHTSTLVKIYRPGTTTINFLNDTTILPNITHIYSLIDFEPNYNEYLINGKMVRISKTDFGTFSIRTSTNNFSTYSEIFIEPNQHHSIDNFLLLFGKNELLLSMNLTLFNPINPLGFYINEFILNITSGLSTIKNVEPLQAIVADAYAEISVPISVMTSTFYYQSDAINVDDILSEDLKFKTAYNSYWNTFCPTQAVVIENRIPFYKTAMDAEKYKIKHDFVRYLALKIFKTPQGVDIFSNNDALTANLDALSTYAFNLKMHSYTNLGEELFDVDISGNLSRIIFYEILNTYPGRIAPKTNEWSSMPFYAGDQIYIKLIINPNQDQLNIFKKNIGTTPIPPRTYSIKLKMVPG
jgi:hypothetical protein